MPSFSQCSSSPIRRSGSGRVRTRSEHASPGGRPAPSRASRRSAPRWRWRHRPSGSALSPARSARAPTDAAQGDRGVGPVILVEADGGPPPRALSEGLKGLLHVGRIAGHGQCRHGTAVPTLGWPREPVVGSSSVAVWWPGTRSTSRSAWPCLDDRARASAVSDDWGRGIEGGMKVATSLARRSRTSSMESGQPPADGR